MVSTHMLSHLLRKAQSALSSPAIIKQNLEVAELGYVRILLKTSGGLSSEVGTESTIFLSYLKKMKVVVMIE